ARDYNFSLVRNDQARPDWQRVFMDPAAARPRPAYLLQDAYCVLELSAERGSERLRVHDYAFRTPQGRRDLLAFWGNFRGQVETVDLRLPAGEPLLLDTANQPSPHQSVWQVRVVDVGRALAPLAGRQEASFCLRVHDDFCAWNDQTFRLVLGPEGTTVQPAAHTPDLSVDVRALPALLSGSLSAHAAMKAGMAEGELPCAEALAALAGGRTPYLSRADFF
ncbi:MAG TPA: sterol carrier protein domain-containing protein, partial [Trueperaceae bacterium]